MLKKQQPFIKKSLAQTDNNLERLDNNIFRNYTFFAPKQF